MKARLRLGLAVLAAAVAGMAAGCSRSESPVLAVVGDEEITVGDFEDYIRGFRKGYKSAQEEFDRKSEMLDSMVVTRLLVQTAYEKNIDKLEEVARVVLANRERFLLDALYQNHIVSQVSVSDAEIREHYNGLEYQIRAAHILVNSEDTANMLLEHLSDGDDFEQLAYEHSVDPSAKRNRGDMGYFTRGSMVAEFENVAFSMEPGEIAPPVKTRYGYHIIKLIDKKPNELRESFEQMESTIRQKLESKERFSLTDDYFSMIRDKYPISLDSSVADYVMHKRKQLYPPQVRENLPRNDFDEEQLDRNERELPLAIWEGGQVTLIDYLLTARRALQPQMKPDLDDYDSVTAIIFELKKSEILAWEATREGLENSDIFKQKMKLFKEYSMADVMRNDSISIPPPPSEEELRTHYDENKEEFAVPAKIHLYEILVSDELLAQRLTKEIKSRDEFRRKAAELTERSGMRVKKGDLGYIERKWFAELFDAAWKTPMETVGGPVRTLRRYSIFYPIDRIPKEYKDFLDVKRDIQQKLQAERQQEAFAEWVSERKAITKIEVSYDDLWETIDMEAYASAETDTLSSP